MEEIATATPVPQGLSMKDDGHSSGPRAIALRTLADVERFSTLIYKSTLVPKDYRNNLADVIGIITFGLEIGLNPMQSLQNIAWINSKPSVYGDMLLALVEASGLLESFDEVDPDEALKTGMARCSVKRRGRQEITRTFTKADAETAKLWTKDIWRAYPGRMLQMRARSWALRDAFSDVLKGLIAREEAQDIIDVIPQASVTPTPAPDEAPDEMQAFLLEQIMATLKEVAPSASPEDREHRIHLISEAFGVSGWSQVKPLSVPQLEAGYQHLKALVTAEEIHDVEESLETDVPLTYPPDAPDSPEMHESPLENTGIAVDSRSVIVEAASPTHEDSLATPVWAPSPEQETLRQEALGWGIPDDEIISLLQRYTSIARARSALWKVRMAPVPEPALE